MTRFSSIVLVDARGWVLLQERDEFPAIDPEDVKALTACIDYVVDHAA